MSRVSVRVLGWMMCVLACVAVLEAGTRVLLPGFSPAGDLRFEFDAGRKLIAGPKGAVQRQSRSTGDYDVEIRFNRHGLRDDDDFLGFSDGDWFVFGDSFTFGWGVKEDLRYSDVVEKLTGLRVFNVAAPGNISHYAQWLGHVEQNVKRVDRLLLGLCLDNDILDYAVSDTGNPQSRPTPVLVRSKRWLTARSAFYRAVTAAVHSSESLRKVAVKTGLVDDVDATNASTVTAREIDATVAGIRDFASSRQLVVLLIPQRAALAPASQDALEMHQRLRDAIEAAGIHFVDPLPVFNSHPDPRAQFYFRHDGHWTAAAHRVAGELIVQAMHKARAVSARTRP